MAYPRATTLRSAVVLAALSWLSVANATCYRPDGLAVDDTYQPCNGSAPVSMCCHTSSSNINGDACGTGSQYGLCGVTGTQLWRESCTDPTWKSPACLNLCATGSGASPFSIPASEDSMITACNDGSYCCGQNNATCCHNNEGLFIVNNQVALTASSTSTSTSTSSPSSTSSAQSSSTSTLTQTTTTSSASSISSQILQKSGLSRGAKAGIGVGASVGALGVLAALGCVLWKQKRKSGLDDHSETEKPNAIEIERSELDGVSTVQDEEWSVREEASSEPRLEGSIEEEPRGRALYRRGEVPRDGRIELAA